MTAVATMYLCSASSYTDVVIILYCEDPSSTTHPVRHLLQGVQRESVTPDFASTESTLRFRSAALAFVVMDASGRSEQAAGDECEDVVDTGGGEGASASRCQRASTGPTAGD